MIETAYRTETLVSIENVSLLFGDKVILRDINIKVDNLHRDSCTTGQVVAFLGPSGVGKTQLMRIMAGLSQPTTGAIFINADHHLVRPGLVGMVMQTNPLFRHRTVLGNLMLAARQRPGADGDAKNKSMEMLCKFGMAEQASLYPAQLSGGMKQRVAIAQQLLCSDHFLLMDEPFAALDPVNVKRVCGLITDVANQHDLNTVIVVTHDIRAALSVADTVWIMGREQGKLGATIVHTVDLIAEGLCWHPELSQSIHFMEVERGTREMFNHL